MFRTLFTRLPRQTYVRIFSRSCSRAKSKGFPSRFFTWALFGGALVAGPYISAAIVKYTVLPRLEKQGIHINFTVPFLEEPITFRNVVVKHDSTGFEAKIEKLVMPVAFWKPRVCSGVRAEINMQHNISPKTKAALPKSLQLADAIIEVIPGPRKVLLDDIDSPSGQQHQTPELALVPSAPIRLTINNLLYNVDRSADPVAVLLNINADGAINGSPFVLTNENLHQPSSMRHVENFPVGLLLLLFGGPPDPIITNVFPHLQNGLIDFDSELTTEPGITASLQHTSQCWYQLRLRKAGVEPLELEFAFTVQWETPAELRAKEVELFKKHFAEALADKLGLRG